MTQVGPKGNHNVVTMCYTRCAALSRSDAYPCEVSADKRTTPRCANSRGLGRTIQEFDMEQRTCSVCDVTIPPRKRRQGMCLACYQRWMRHGKITPKPLYGLALFWSKVNKTATCWLWTGSINPAGYGQFGDRRYFGAKLAHRIAYIAARGEIPDGLVLDHLCRVRNCVNPNHLEPVTTQENIARGFAPPAVNARKTVCVCGRPYDIDRKDGRRGCRACMARMQATWYQRSKAAAQA